MRIRGRCEGSKEFCWVVPSAQTKKVLLDHGSKEAVTKKTPKKFASSSNVARKQTRRGGGKHLEHTAKPLQHGHNETELAKRNTRSKVSPKKTRTDISCGCTLDKPYIHSGEN